MNVSIRLVTPDDVPILTELLTANRDHLAPWDPIRPDDYFTVAGQRGVMDTLLAGLAAGTTVPQVILDDGEVVGRITLNNVIRGPLQSCSVGYWVDAGHTGRGVAGAALALIARVAFGELDLHRIEAGTLLHNVASQRVLERNGFVRFGVAPRAIKIAGRWQDHVLFQLLAD